MKKKILVSFIEAGLGHITTAQAICEQLERKYANEIEVIRLPYKNSGIKEFEDFEKFCVNEVFRACKQKNRLSFQMLLMHILGQNNTLKLVYNTKFRKFKKKVIEIYSSYNADIILTTYFADLHCMCCGKKQGKIKSIVSAYNPDHNTHGWWDKRVEMFICNNLMASEEAIKKSKMKANNVYTTDFIARSFLQDIKEDKNFYRSKYGLPLDKFAVILVDGAYGMAKMESFTDELLQTDLPITIVAMCGKNEPLFQKYSNLQNIKPNITLLPCRFVPNIAEYFKACNLTITKAGPNTITDSVFMHTPVMTNYYTGPIEEASNKLFVEQYKMGLFCKEPVKAREKIESFIQNPSLLDEYIKNTKSMDINKNGAEQIADLFAQKLGIAVK